MTKLYVSLVTFHKKLFSGSVIVNAIIVLFHTEIIGMFLM